MTKLRIGAVSYLNAKPLVYRLAEFASQAEVRFDVPSQLADRLAHGDLDVGLIPSVEFFRQPTYAVVSDACIACRGPVLSVKLFSRVPVSDLCTVALDEGSRTSVALLRILLHHRFGLSPVFRLLPIGNNPKDVDTDALLLIGDRAIRPPEEDFIEEWDLGEQWWHWVQMPFVFAMWVARPDVDAEWLAPALEQARTEGVCHLHEIAVDHAASAGLTREACVHYLRDNLHFQMGLDEQRGLERFRDLAEELRCLGGSECDSSSLPT